MYKLNIFMSQMHFVPGWDLNNGDSIFLKPDCGSIMASLHIEHIYLFGTIVSCILNTIFALQCVFFEKFSKTRFSIFVHKIQKCTLYDFCLLWIYLSLKYFWVHIDRFDSYLSFTTSQNVISKLQNTLVLSKFSKKIYD